MACMRFVISVSVIMVLHTKFSKETKAHTHSNFSLVPSLEYDWHYVEITYTML